MQNAKDSFYIALRDRLAALNPVRMVKVRGAQRPSLLVEDAETAQNQLMNDVFVLRWTSVAVVPQYSCRLISLSCELIYSTSGTQGIAGLDRGRSLSEMDRELLAILHPLCTPKRDYAPTAAMRTNVFWTEPELGITVADRNALTRTARTTVFSFEESGEL